MYYENAYRFLPVFPQNIVYKALSWDNLSLQARVIYRMCLIYSVLCKMLPEQVTYEGRWPHLWIEFVQHYVKALFRAVKDLM